MSNISVRLPDDVLEKLEREADASNRKRSELIRAAVVDYLDRLARDRLLEEMVAEARAGYGDAVVRRDALRIEQDFSAVEVPPEDEDEKWWK